MAPIPRIMVLDPTYRLGYLVRAALALLGRQHIIIEMPTAEDALDEIFRGSIDLAVTAYVLDGPLNGIEWAEKAIRGQAGTTVIIAANSDDPKPEPARLEHAPYKYLSHASSENFLRAIRIGLDGEDVVAAEEGTAQAHLDLGPVPPLDLNTARKLLIDTMRELSPIGALVADRVGRIVIDEGATGYIDKSLTAALLGPTFSQAVKIAPQIGGNGWTFKLVEGERYNIFALAVGYHYFVLFLMDANSKQALGLINRYGREMVNKIIETLGSRAWEFEIVEPVIAEVPAVSAEKAPAKLKTATVEISPEPSTDLSTKLLEQKLDPVANIDLDVLFNQTASEGDFDNIFSSELLDASSLLDDDSVSYEEAQNMGLLGE